MAGTARHKHAAVNKVNSVKKNNTSNESRKVSRMMSALRLLVGLGCGISAAFAFAQADTSRTGLTVSIPNGYAHITVDDMKLMSTAGQIPWTRTWNGKEWKFNPQWESLSQSWTNMTGSETGSTDGDDGSSSSGGGSSAGGGGGSGSTLSAPPTDAASGCWVWVDEDWKPSTGMVAVGGQPIGAPMAPERTMPFNRVMGDEQQDDYSPPRMVSVDYASLCRGGVVLSTPVRDVEALRLKNELYLGEGGRYAFSNRAVLEKRAVRALPPLAAAEMDMRLAAGSIALAPVPIAKGYRWMDKSGQWIDYNTQGQVVAYGDKNDNTVWLARDTNGMVRGVVDANGRVVYTLHYTKGLLAEMRDYPIAGMAGDLPARSVKYEYDAADRLTTVVDVQGNTTRYGYDTDNRIVSITDQEGRIEKLAYAGTSVTKRTWPDGGVTDYSFDYDDVNKQFISRITGPETAAGRSVEDFTHNRSGKLVRHTVNGRVDEGVRYDTAARAETRTNARGFTSRFVFNEFEQIVQHDREDGTTLKYEYSALNLTLTAEIDAAGVRSNYEYDAKGNLTKYTEAVGTPDVRMTEYEVTPFGQIASITVKGRAEADGTVTPDAITRMAYDNLGNPKEITKPEGGVRRFQHDRLGNVVVDTDPRGYTSTFEYDARGLLIKDTDAMKISYSYRYDKVGNLIVEADAYGRETRYLHDQSNRLTRITSPRNGTSTNQYNAQDMLIAKTDADGRRIAAEYDNFQRLSKLSDAMGNDFQFGYQITDGTTAGMLGSLTKPVEIIHPTFSETRRYDRSERLTSRTTVEPVFGERTTARNYDLKGMVKSETDAYGKTSEYEVNTFGRPTTFKDRLGNVSRFKYDVRSNRMQVTDARGNTRRYEYDRNDRVIREILPLGQVSQISYDLSDNVTMFVDPSGRKRTFSYDAKDRIIEMRRFDATNTLESIIGYTWDSNDQLVGWSDHTAGQTSSSMISYDENSRRTGETVTYPGGFTMGYTYGYSQAGKKTHLKWPDGTTIGYEYSGNGELSGVTIPGEGSISLGQFKWVAPTEVVLPGGTLQRRDYDGLLNPSVLEVRAPDRQVLLSMTNTYGALEEAIRSTRADVQGAATILGYTYDGDNRLTRVTIDSGANTSATIESFTLDTVGNRTAHSRIEGVWTYDANNRLIQSGTGENAVTYAYDDAGNLVRKNEPGNRITKYVYNQGGRLAEVRSGSNELIARYGYDVAGRRIWKEQFRNNQSASLTQAIRTYFLYADEGLVAEAEQAITLKDDESVVANGTASIVTQYGLRPDSQFTTGILFLKTKNSNGQNTFAYYHHDQRMAPVQATDRAGKVVWAATYDAFGKATITTPRASIDNPTISSNLRLPGQVEDVETGMYYNYRRDYDPQTGRYIQSDPIGVSGSINTYVYALANPIALTDPDGLRPIPRARPGGNAYDRRQYRRHNPPRVSMPIGVDNVQEAEGYYDPQGDFVCLKWNCPINKNQCSPADTKKSSDFIPAATDPTSPPPGCTCAAPGYEKKYGPEGPGVDDLLELRNDYKDFREQLPRFRRG